MRTTKHDYVYREIDDPTLDEFNAILHEMEVEVYKKGGDKLRINVEECGISFEFERPLTEEELEYERARKALEEKIISESMIREQQQKWKTFRQLADELGVKIDG